MNLPRYKYKPLKRPNEIRVLELSGTKTRIEVCIHHVPVTSRCFEALSYVWGNPDQADEAIILDHLGNPIGWIPLTENLGNAMRNLRDSEELKSKTFWMDQICINQQDNTEKSWQVAMMDQVYTQATRVITYLGPFESEQEEHGIKLLERIYSNITIDSWNKMLEAGGLQQIRNWKAEGRIKLISLPSDLDIVPENFHDEEQMLKRYSEQGWEWLMRVGYGEWTKRLWIVQEQLLNKEITMLRGHRLVDWDAIVAIPILFSIDYLPRQYREVGRRRLGENSLSWDKVEATLYGTWWERRSRLKSGTSHTWSTLFHNLRWYQPLLCWDPRDRAYALLAISRDAQALRLRPDYSPRNTVDAFSRQLSISILENADDLKLLSFALDWRQPNSNLPSWALTLSHSRGVDTLENLPLDVYAPHPKQWGNDLVQFRMGGSVLVVKGRILDYVSSSSSSFEPSWNGVATNSPQVLFLSSFVNILSDASSLKALISLLRTVTARAPWSNLNGPVEADEILGFHLWAYLRHRTRTLERWAGTPPVATQKISETCIDLMKKIQAFTPGIDYSGLPATNYVDAVEWNATRKVIPYALEDGRYLGRTRIGRLYNATSAIHGGDAIVSLQGADRLYVIRAIEKTYEIIGDIFVDGLMDGGAYEGLDPDEVDYEIELT